MVANTTIPTAVLSEHFQELMEGRVLKSGVFLTFSLDPGFFEQEILPAFMDIPLSHEPAVRLLQLEDAIRTQIDQIAVYYDPRAIDEEVKPAKLDFKRFPVRWPTGYFHPKNVLLLVEDAEAVEDGTKARRLIVGTLSANLTRSGWWENVETCHVEVLEPGEKSSLKGDLLQLFSRLRRAVASETEHAALREIEKFVKGLDERLQSTAEGVLHTRLYVGATDGRGAGQSVPDFLDEVRGKELRGCNLEVISPFFDDTAVAAPLAELIERFEPGEVRVLLPRGPDGSALCGQAYFDAVRKLPNTLWARLPSAIIESGTEAGLPRRVHAKVYRFFEQKRSYEALFVGSVNLTSAAHSKGGNFETAVLVEPPVDRAPDWWLVLDKVKPLEFKGAGESTEESGQGPGVALSIRYSWASGTADAFWDANEGSPILHVDGGEPLFDVGPLPSRRWGVLTNEQGAAVRAVLGRTSLLSVRVDGKEPATILVQEDGMAQKPSILLNMSVSDILRCWSALTPEQKAVLLEERYAELAGSVSALMSKIPLGRLPTPSLFDAFAGIFHAFGNLERSVTKALSSQREKEAVHLLFGQKYDSLPLLLKRLSEPGESRGSANADPINRYVMVLCARQVLARIKEAAPAEFRAHYAAELRSLAEQLASMDGLRAELSLGEPEERDRFLKWFESWFLRRAEPVEAAE